MHGRPFGRRPVPYEGRTMRIGVPAEIKNNEFRVAITPSGVHALTRRGHEVTVQAGAGAGSGIDDGETMTS